MAKKKNIIHDRTLLAPLQLNQLLRHNIIKNRFINNTLTLNQTHSNNTIRNLNNNVSSLSLTTTLTKLQSYQFNPNSLFSISQPLSYNHSHLISLTDQINFEGLVSETLNLAQLPHTTLAPTQLTLFDKWIYEIEDHRLNFTQHVDKILTINLTVPADLDLVFIQTIDLIYIPFFRTTSLLLFQQQVICHKTRTINVTHTLDFFSDYNQDSTTLYQLSDILILSQELFGFVVHTLKEESVSNTLTLTDQPNSIYVHNRKISNQLILSHNLTQEQDNRSVLVIFHSLSYLLNNHELVSQTLPLNHTVSQLNSFDRSLSEQLRINHTMKLIKYSGGSVSVHHGGDTFKPWKPLSFGKPIVGD